MMASNTFHKSNMLKNIMTSIGMATLLWSCEHTSIEKSDQDTFIHHPDTLTIEKNRLDSIEVDDVFADWPFVDSIVDSHYFMTRLSNQATLKTVLKENIYDSNVTDTLRTIQWDSSYVETISNSYTKQEYIQALTLDDPSFTLKQEIKVGMPEEMIFKIFHTNYDRHKTYLYFSVSHGDGAVNYVIFYFRQKKVKFIAYSPYTG